LEVFGGSFTREVDASRHDMIWCGSQEIFGDNRLANSCLSSDKHVMTSSYQRAEKELVFDCVTGWHKNFEEANIRIISEAWDLFMPVL